MNRIKVVDSQADKAKLSFKPMELMIVMKRQSFEL